MPKTLQFLHTHSHHSFITSTWGQAFGRTWASAAAAGCFGSQRFWEEIESGPGAASEWKFRELQENALKAWGDDDNSEEEWILGDVHCWRCAPALNLQTAWKPTSLQAHL